MTKPKKELRDPRFRILEDFIHVTSTLQEFVFFEDGGRSGAKVNLLELRRLYKRAFRKIPAHKEYFVEVKEQWVHESKMGKIKTRGLDWKYVEEEQVRARPFDNTDTAVVELGSRAFDLCRLHQDYARDSKGYFSIIETLQERGLVSRVIGDNLTNNV